MINTLPIQINNCNNIQKVNHAPVFTGLKPNDKMTQKSNNIAKKIYQALFLDGNSKICKVKDGFVYTQNRSGSEIISKKIKFLHIKPEAIIKDDTSALLREKVVFNKNGTSDVEIQDIYTKGYKVSASYSGVKDTHDSGVVKINYGDNQFEISKEKRDALRHDFVEFLNTKFSKSIEEMHQMTKSEIDSYMKEYYLTPETTAEAILTSPRALKEQLENVNRAMPYGIECIMEKLGK